MQVTASNETLGSGSSTSTRQQQEQGESNTPFDKALEQVNESMKAWDTGMRFDLDTEAERMVVSIIDSATGEVLRTIPNEAVIRVAKMIVQLQGNLVNTKA
jgi:flagellar protein FlaG